MLLSIGTWAGQDGGEALLLLVLLGVGLGVAVLVDLAVVGTVGVVAGPIAAIRRLLVGMVLVLLLILILLLLVRSIHVVGAATGVGPCPASIAALVLMLHWRLLLVLLVLLAAYHRRLPVVGSVATGRHTSVGGRVVVLGGAGLALLPMTSLLSPVAMSSAVVVLVVGARRGREWRGRRAARGVALDGDAHEPMG